MFKSNPIPMVSENKQVSAVRLITCYQYKSNGVHINSSALNVEIYGIDKNGDENLIAKCPLETTANYKSGGYASNVVVGIQTKEYPFIYYKYDVSTATDFLRMNKQPMLTVDVREFPDVVESNIKTIAIG